MQSGSAEDREHRRYSPSQIERIELCPGSVNLLERTPARLPSKYAQEGTEAHDVLHVALSNGIRDAKLAKEESYVFHKDFEADFYYSIQATLNYVYDILDTYPDAVMWLEQFVDVPSKAAPGEAGGSADIIIWIPSQRRLYVIDFKHGSGVVKEAERLPQAMQYGAGVLYGSDMIDTPNGVEKDIDVVTLVVAQPRAFHSDGSIRDWDTTPFELYEYLEDMDEVIRKAQQPNAPLVPGETQCMFCDARTTCPARETMALQKINTQFGNIRDVIEAKIPNVKDLDVTRLSHIRAWKPFIEKFFDDVENHMHELMRGGFDVPGWKLVETQAKREWYGDEDMLAPRLAALAQVPVTDVIRMKLITITEAERLVVDRYKQNAGRGKKKQAAEDAKAAFAHLTIKKSSGSLTIAPADDPRPAVNRAAMALGGIAGIVAPPTEK